MGGTRFLPGSHLRVVSEAAISRYQNIVGQQHVVCPAGTVLIREDFGTGSLNRSDQIRFLYDPARTGMQSDSGTPMI